MGDLKKNLVLLKERLERFLHYEVWKIDEMSLPPSLRFALKLLRTLYMIFQRFLQKHTFVKASALSYTTVLSIIPLLILTFSLSKGFLREQTNIWVPKIIDHVVENIVPYLDGIPARDKDEIKMKQSVKGRFVRRFSDYLASMDAGKMGLVGAVPLIVIAYLLLRTIENAINDIWGIKRGRSIWQCLLRYWCAVTLLPIVLIFTIWLTGHKQISVLLQGFGESAVLFSEFYNPTPFLVLCAAFTFFYKAVPNTPVRFSAALTGGVVAGLLWEINNELSFMYLSNAIRMQTLYGSLGIIPIFLIALYFAWLIILFGAHTAFAVQNIDIFRRENLIEEITPATQQVIATACLLMINDSFQKGKSSPSKLELAERLILPEAYLENALLSLQNSQIIQENNLDPPGYTLLKPPEKLFLYDIMTLIIDDKNNQQSVQDNPVMSKITKICDDFRKAGKKTMNPSVQDISKNYKLFNVESKV